MSRSVLVPNVKQLIDHYVRQQRGGNIIGFRGARIQRGHGTGGIFKSLARIAIPLFKRGANAIGKRALQADTEVGQDVLEVACVAGGIRGHKGGSLKYRLPKN